MKFIALFLYVIIVKIRVETMKTPTTMTSKTPTTMTSEEISTELGLMFHKFIDEHERIKKRSLFEDMIRKIPLGNKYQDYENFKNKKWLSADEVEKAIKKIFPYDHAPELMKELGLSGERL